MHCTYSEVCSGCDLLKMGYDQQKQLKTEQLTTLFLQRAYPPLQFQTFGETGLRSRLDFVLDHGKLGLFSKKTGQTEDLPICLQLTPELQNYYTEFRKIKWPDIKGSFRLRVGPHGDKRGAWLDFANLDIQSLLKMETPLLQLLELGSVEIGQKHKILGRKETGLGLHDPQFQIWSETTFQNQTVPLLSTIASFTQPSHVTNAWITRKIQSWVQHQKPRTILEFGAGIGNLTLPAVYNSEVHVNVLEYDKMSAKALELNAQNLNIQNQITIQVGDFRKKSATIPDANLYLLNPARNGVGETLKDLENKKSRPQSLIYMSCYPETLALDTQNLESLGYSLKELIIVDQFPQTHHMEVLSFWCKA